MSINENWDPDVRTDLDKSLDRIAPEGDFYLHDAEGPDDSVLHIKSSTIGVSLSIPITNGRLSLGQWQGSTFVNLEGTDIAEPLLPQLMGKEIEIYVH